MKASFKFIIAALAAAVALTACTKEITPNFENDKVNPVAEGSRVIAVSFGNRTKTYLADDGLQPKFNDGDSIFLCTKADKQEDIVTDIRRVSVDDYGNATITTELTGELVAWYPARAVTYDDYSGGYNILNTPVQTGMFADANICSAAIDETAKKATFENKYALLIVTPPEGAQSLTIRSLKVIEESSGQRTGKSAAINVSTVTDSAYFVTVPTPPKDEGKYYVALREKVYMSNLSFEVEFEKEGTGSIKGIPLSRIEENAAALGESANRYNFIDEGTAYTIDDKNWHEYVEVGGHKWATMNVGAEKPEEAGVYFSWGEVIGQTPSSSSTFSPGFSWSNCPFAVGGKSKFNKYVPASKTSYLAEGFSGDPKTTLDLVDDAAYANWGGSWRMPTKEEFDALASKKLTFSSGYYFGDSHENKIFLPTAGCGYGTDLDGASSGGDYWSSSLDTDNPFNASYLFFFDGDANTDFNYRYSGLSVRAIIDNAASAPDKPEDPEEESPATEMEEEVLF